MDWFVKIKSVPLLHAKCLFLMNDVRWPAVEGGKRVFGSSLLHCFNSAIVLLMNEVLWPANQC